jgi:hypothetical protein
MIVDKFGGAVEEPLFRYAPQGIPPPQKQDQKQQQQSKPKPKPSKTGAAPSSCE